mgnify:CR=1 FL=1
MGKTLRPYEPDQRLLLPPAIEDWVPEDHLARFVGDVVDDLDGLREAFERLLPQLRGSPLVTVSAKTGRGLDRLRAAIEKAYDVCNRRVTTAQLYRWLTGMLEAHPPPAPVDDSDRVQVTGALRDGIATVQEAGMYAVTANGNFSASVGSARAFVEWVQETSAQRFYRQPIGASDSYWGIGVVFGQRTQLWWDLPVVESFELLRDIYRLEQAAYASTLDELIERLELAPLLDVPVRQLSLGQRMRCDLAAALLHDVVEDTEVSTAEV